MQVHNLTFHGVGEAPRALEPGEAHVWLSEDRFTAVLDAVRDRPDVRLSFDDSFRSDVEVALPALRDRGLTATFFVLAGRLGHPEHLDADAVRALRTAGMTIGSHGLEHRNWRTLDEGEMGRELEQARDILSAAAGEPVTHASVPFGAYDRRVLARVRAAGFDRVFTSDGGPADDGAWLQPRTSVTVDSAPAGLAVRPSAAATTTLTVKRLVKRWR
jgi:peptidoglycan/xylan/chitin deacetylase (PgdA/CDA1 family)